MPGPGGMGPGGGGFGGPMGGGFGGPMGGGMPGGPMGGGYMPGPAWRPYHSDSSYNGGVSPGIQGVENDDYIMADPSLLTIKGNIKLAQRVFHNKDHGYKIYKTMKNLEEEGKETKIRFGNKVKGFFKGLGMSLIEPFAKLRFDAFCRAALTNKNQLLEQLPHDVDNDADYYSRKEQIERNYNIKTFNNHERRLRKAYKNGLISGKQYNDMFAQYMEKFHLTDQDITRAR